mgnify:CR=1 FL=1
MLSAGRECLHRAAGLLLRSAGRRAVIGCLYPHNMQPRPQGLLGFCRTWALGCKVHYSCSMVTGLRPATPCALSSLQSAHLRQPAQSQQHGIFRDVAVSAWTCCYPGCTNMAGQQELSLPLKKCAGCGEARYCSRQVMFRSAFGSPAIMCAQL